MKKIFSFILLATFALSVNAQRYMSVTQKDGSVTEYALSDIDSIHFFVKETIPPTTDPFNGHEYVDLGLTSGTLWATCNVGATNPEDYGDYFAWGETETTTKETYNWATYKYGTYNYDNDFSTLTKYNPTDGKTILEPSDDAATANWGGEWRMPTKAEQDELRTECTWTKTILNGVDGYEVKGTNGNSIFFPAAGYQNGTSLNETGLGGYYWSSSLDESSMNAAYALCFYSPSMYPYAFHRCYGRPVRPVCSPAK